ncbi:MAG: sarcosine oxidase subunit gamma family protein, partial [Anaerolineales bacterium]|nr:sarcosine oxidase subunit gamma family protein [Anaerolineales bacterium]
EGDRSSRLIFTAIGVHAPSIGQSVACEEGRVYALRPDLFFVATAPGVETELVDRVRAVDADAGGLAIVTDVTSGRAQIRVTGSLCRQLLPKLCGLDFGENSFMDGCAKTSSLAKTTQLILRCDRDGILSFGIVGGRSLGAYLWEMMLQAGREWGITPVID